MFSAKQSRSTQRSIQARSLAPFIALVTVLVISAASTTAHAKKAASCKGNTKGKTLVFQCNDKAVQKWMNSQKFSSNLKSNGKLLQQSIGSRAQKSPPPSSYQAQSGEGRDIEIEITIGPITIGGKFPCCKGGGGKKKKKKGGDTETETTEADTETGDKKKLL